MDRGLCSTGPLEIWGTARQTRRDDRLSQGVRATTWWIVELLVLGTKLLAHINSIST